MQRVRGPLDKLIDIVGGVAELAEQLGVDRKTIFLWQDKDPDVTGKLKVNILCRAFSIEEIYKD
jgi:DNA-binding XRE family transcriptional regulator